MVRKGLPKSIIKKYGITKKAWSVYRGRSKSKSKRTKTTRRKNKPKRRRTYMARRKRRRGGKSMTRTAFKLIRLGALVAPAGYAAATQPDLPNKVASALVMYTGYNIRDGRFYPSELAKGWGPFLMACLATYGIPKISGIIRRL